jgi:hypothetical protein
MFLAKELGKSLNEVLEYSTFELRLWAGFYKFEGERQKKVQQTKRRK